MRLRRLVRHRHRLLLRNSEGVVRVRQRAGEVVVAGGEVKLRLLGQPTLSHLMKQGAEEVVLLLHLRDADLVLVALLLHRLFIA